MKIILAAVVSADGVMAPSSDGASPPALWASAEDQEFFNDLKKKIGVVIMGRKTFEAAGKPRNDGIKRVILSRNGKSIREIISDLENAGHKEALLVGGSEINAAFFAEKLVNEIYLTVEPKIFGAGLFLSKGALDGISLELLEIKRLNDKGTMLLHYKVL